MACSRLVMTLAWETITPAGVRVDLDVHLQQAAPLSGQLSVSSTGTVRNHFDWPVAVAPSRTGRPTKRPTRCNVMMYSKACGREDRHQITACAGALRSSAAASDRRRDS